VVGGTGADDFGRKKIIVTANDSDQLAIAVVVGAAADVYSSDAAWIRDVACGTREVSDFVHHVACGRMAGQPLHMPTQESSECGDVSGRRFQPAFVDDEAGPGC
jgi:hypothetical protein